MADGTSTLLSANIKRLREEAGLSQKALAELSGVPRPTIAHLESGQANPTLSVTLKVASSLGVAVDELVRGEEAPILIQSFRSLPVEKTSRIRRVLVAAAGLIRDAKVERITIKAASRLRVEASEQSPVVLSVESGGFVVSVRDNEYPLPAEAVAQIRAPIECLSQQGGTLYLISSR